MANDDQAYCTTEKVRLYVESYQWTCPHCGESNIEDEADSIQMGSPLCPVTCERCRMSFYTEPLKLE